MKSIEDHIAKDKEIRADPKTSEPMRHHIEDEFEGHMYYDWLLSQEQKIQMIEKNIIGIHKKLDSMERK